MSDNPVAQQILSLAEVFPVLKQGGYTVSLGQGWDRHYHTELRSRTGDFLGLVRERAARMIRESELTEHFYSKAGSSYRLKKPKALSSLEARSDRTEEVTP